MDSSLINDKIKNNAYKKLAEFQSDCQNIVNFVSVLNGPNSMIASLSSNDKYLWPISYGRIF